MFAIAAIIEPGATATNLLIQNSVFWNPAGVGMSNEMVLHDSKGGTCSSITIRYNLISDNIYDGCSPMTVVGNIQRAAQATCIPGWDYNVLVNATACGAHAVRGSNAMFVSSSHGDFRLRPHSAAIGRGDPKIFPRRIASAYPSVRGKRDAGPYEAKG